MQHCSKLQSKIETMNWGYKWSCKFLFGIFLLTGQFDIGSMHATGAPDTACAEMDPTPGHKVVKQPESIISFDLLSDTAIVEGGDTMTLQFAPKRVSPSAVSVFKGFMVQARPIKCNWIKIVKKKILDCHQSDKTIGEFDMEKNDKAVVKPMICNGRNGSSVTHVSSQDKTYLELTWTSPKLENENDTKVWFFFTLVESKTKYWVKQKAQYPVLVKGHWSPTTNGGKAWM